MSTVRQVSLLQAGCQPWNLNVVASKGSRFAYAATLAIYIYDLNRKTGQFYLHSIMSEHKKTVTAISWHPSDPDLIASCSTDPRLCVWHVIQHSLVAVLDTPSAVPTLISWFPEESECVAYTDGRGPLYLWRYTQQEGSGGPSSVPLKELATVVSNITQLCWHRSVSGRLAMGHADGTLSLYIQGRKPHRHVKPVGGSSDKESEDSQSRPITALQWDPFSPNYLLVSSRYGQLQLIDTSSEPVSVVTTYTTPSKAVTIKSVAWLTEAPGAFISGDAETGVLRIWTVSKDKPLENLRLKQTGFQALCTLPPDSSSATASQQQGKSGLNGKMKLNSRIVCLFLDGGVGVYNLKCSSWEFFRDMGHLETIFDCQFKPDNCDLLATASFDGTVKLWNVNTMEAVNTTPGDESIIYSLSWAPADIDCLAAATSKNGIFIWNVAKGCITKRIEDHGKNVYVYCVAWNQTDARKIASTGADGTCMVHQIDGTLMQTFKHPATVYGCDWNPNNESILATGCEDGQIRIFYDGTGTTQPLKTLTGHTGKVFRVKWSPLKEGILCSTSDDCTVRIWDYSSGAAIRVLEGHTNYGRGLVWNPELPNIVVSGSWDYTIRVWDISDGACLDIIEDHGGDVYGLACHPQRPFLFASTSRDSTVRLWSVLPLVSTSFLKALVKRPWNEIFAPTVTQQSSGGDSLGLYGVQSKRVKECVAKVEDRHHLQTLTLISGLFCPPAGVENLWNLVSVLKGQDVDQLLSYKTGIVHRKHVVKLMASKAQEKELVKMTRFGAGGVGAASKEECLRMAAESYLFVGNLRKYCELKVELGEWKDALAVAPGVSMQYWQELSNRWVKVLMEENNSFVVPLSIATHNIGQLLKFYRKQNHLEQAYLVSVAVSDGVLQNNSNRQAHGNGNTLNGETKCSIKEEEKDCESLVLENIRNLSERYMQSGSPVLAACCQLAVDNIQGALSSLLRGHELELAVSVSLALNENGPLLESALTYLAWRCVHKGDWDLGLDILDLCPDTQVQKAQLCANCGMSLSERNRLHAKAGLPPVESCLQEAKDGDDNNIPLLKIVQYYLLSTEPRKGLDIGLKYVNDALSYPAWRLQPVWQMLQVMGSVRSQVLQDTNCDRHRFELQVYSAYVGALVAMRQGFHPIVVPLLTTAVSLIRRVHNANLAISEDLLTSELRAWVAAQNDSQKLSDDYKEIYRDLTSKVFEDPPTGDIGVTVVTGSHLPRHSDQHRCYLRGTSIQGPVFFLEDYTSVISLNDALMWAKVNPFSPLGTGLRINPF